MVVSKMFKGSLGVCQMRAQGPYIYKGGAAQGLHRDCNWNCNCNCALELRTGTGGGSTQSSKTRVTFTGRAMITTACWAAFAHEVPGHTNYDMQKFQVQHMQKIRALFNGHHIPSAGKVLLKLALVSAGQP